MLEITADLTRLGETTPADEFYDISEGSPWAVDEFCERLRMHLKDFEAGDAGLWSASEGAIPCELTIHVRRVQ